MKILSYSVFLILIIAGISNAANYCVRQGASGGADGSTWDDAYTDLPATLERGSTYYVADGSYSAYVADDAVSGTDIITIKKATVADHGIATDWLDTYGDGQANFAGIEVRTNYWMIDGQTRNENDWTDDTAYGFRTTARIWSSGFSPSSDSPCADNVTVKYVEFDLSSESDAVYMLSYDGDDKCADWTIQRNYTHGGGAAVMLNGATDSLIEYNHFGDGWAKETIRGNNGASGHTIRFNKFIDSCQDAGGGGEQCTAEIAMWNSSTAGDYDDNEIYGNIIQKTTADENTGGAIVVGGDGGSWAGVSASNTLVYNNTIVGIDDGQAYILINGGTGNIVRNNLWSDLGVGVSATVTANTESNNSTEATSVFVNYPSDLHLSAETDAGYSLSSPYNTDLDGVNRGSGVWDIGAYEYQAPAQTNKSVGIGLSGCGMH